MRLCILSSRRKTAIPPRGGDTCLGLKSQTPESQCKWCWLVPWNVNGHFIWKSKYYELKTSGARVCNSFQRLLVFLRGPGQSLLWTPHLACRAFYSPLDCLQQRYHVVARWTAGPEYPALLVSLWLWKHKVLNIGPGHSPFGKIFAGTVQNQGRKKFLILKCAH